jgi:hypothetical protein
MRCGGGNTLGSLVYSETSLSTLRYIVPMREHARIYRVSHLILIPHSWSELTVYHPQFRLETLFSICDELYVSLESRDRRDVVVISFGE